MQAIVQTDFFGLSIQIQMHFSKWIDNPIIIKQFLEKTNSIKYFCDIL
jgi:hypothetical protein